MIACRGVTTRKATVPPAITVLGITLENACVDIEDQPACRRGAAVARIELGWLFDLNGTGLPFRGGQASPGGQSLTQNFAHHLGILMVLEPQQFARRGQQVNALASAAAFPSRSLIRNFLEEGSLGIVAATLIPIVAGHGNVQ